MVLSQSMACGGLEIDVSGSTALLLLVWVAGGLATSNRQLAMFSGMPGGMF